MSCFCTYFYEIFSDIVYVQNSSMKYTPEEFLGSIAWRRRLGFWDDARWARRQVVGGHPFPQLQLDAGEWPVIAVAWDGQQASNLRLFLTFRIAAEQGGLSGKNS